MKAIILAAGKGVRLGELSNSLPKPMIKYKGKPILEYNVELCKEFGINDIYINVHHLPEKIISYFGNGEKWGLNIQYVKEEYLLGKNWKKTEKLKVDYGEYIGKLVRKTEKTRSKKKG